MRKQLDEAWQRSELCVYLSSNTAPRPTGGPLKPGFGLNGDVHTSQTWANEQTRLSKDGTWHPVVLVMPAKSNALPPANQVATTRPPAARMTSPVIQADSSDARNTASGAISVTRPSRPSGVFPARTAPAPPSKVPAATLPSVSV